MLSWLMLAHRLRRCPLGDDDISSILGQRLVFGWFNAGQISASLDPC